MMETRSILRTSAALGLALAAMGLADRAEAQDCSVKVGAVLPTSVDWGRPIAETAQWVVDQVNEAGGVNDCQVEMILRDTQVDPKVGVDAAKALVDLDGVPLLLGAVSSGVSMPILTSVTVPAGVMQMSCCSSSTAFTALSEEGKTDGLWFRTFATTGVQAAVGAKVAQDQGWKKVAIFYKNDDWGQDIGKLVASDLEALGIEVTASVAINDAQPSYRAEAASALSAQPDAIYLALYPNEGTAVGARMDLARRDAEHDPRQFAEIGRIPRECGHGLPCQCLGHRYRLAACRQRHGLRRCLRGALRWPAQRPRLGQQL